MLRLTRNGQDIEAELFVDGDAIRVRYTGQHGYRITQILAHVNQDGIRLVQYVEPGFPVARQGGPSGPLAVVPQNRARRSYALTGARLEVLNSVRRYARTAEQISIDTGRSSNCVRPRLLELEEMGYVRPTGLTRRTLSGRTAAIWEAIR